MAGRYYLKHMINHKVDNHYKKKRREETIKNYVSEQEEKEIR